MQQLNNRFKGNFVLVVWCFGPSHKSFIYVKFSPSLPNISTPSAAKIKKRRKKRSPRFPTWGRACITVSRRALIPLAILSNFKTGRKICVWNQLKVKICQVIFTTTNYKVFSHYFEYFLIEKFVLKKLIFYMGYLNLNSGCPINHQGVFHHQVP